MGACPRRHARAQTALRGTGAPRTSRQGPCSSWRSPRAPTRRPRGATCSRSARGGRAAWKRAKSRRLVMCRTRRAGVAVAASRAHSPSYRSQAPSARRARRRPRSMPPGTANGSTGARENSGPACNGGASKMFVAGFFTSKARLLRAACAPHDLKNISEGRRGPGGEKGRRMCPCGARRRSPKKVPISCVKK